MNPRLVAIAVAAVALAALAAGCGTAEKNEYVDTVNEIQARALEAFNETATATPKNTKALVDQLESAEGALAEAVAELEAVEVPEEAQDGHPELVAGLEDLRDLFGQTAKDARGASTSEAFAAVTRLGSKGSEIGTRIDEAISRINSDLGAD